MAAGAAGATASVVQALVAVLGGGAVTAALARAAAGAGYAVVGALLVVPLVIVLDRWVEGEAPEVARL